MASPNLGIEIGGTKLQLYTGDGQGTVQARHQFYVRREAGAEGIRDQLRTALHEVLASLRPAAVGVGFGGPVDREQGVISRSHQIEGWSGFPLRDWLAEIVQAPVILDNDANMAALGEATLGAGKDCNPVFYVTLGSGVGGGLVVNGRVYHGASPTESEIGHVRLDREGTLVEQRCSGWAIDARVRDRITGHDGSALARLVRESPGHEARHLAPALALGDELATEIMRALSEDLALALSHVAHLLNPEVIILGGGLSKIGHPLLETVSRRLPQVLMEVIRPGPELRLSELGEDAVPVGCLLAAGAASPAPVQ